MFKKVTFFLFYYFYSVQTHKKSTFFSCKNPHLSLSFFCDFGYNVVKL